MQLSKAFPNQVSSTWSPRRPVFISLASLSSFATNYSTHFFGNHDARLVHRPNGVSTYLADLTLHRFWGCKQLNAEHCSILYANTRRSSAFLEFHNGNMIKLLEMHVDGYKGRALYSCTPAYSPDFELLHIRIASPRGVGNDPVCSRAVEKTAYPVYNKDLTGSVHENSSAD